MSITSYQQHKVKFFSLHTARGIEVYAVLFVFNGLEESAISEPRLVRVIAQRSTHLALYGSIASKTLALKSGVSAALVQKAKQEKTSSAIVSPYSVLSSTVQFFARPPNFA